MPVYFCAGLSPVTVESLPRDYDKYRGFADNAYEADGLKIVEDDDLNGVFERELL